MIANTLIAFAFAAGALVSASPAARSTKITGCDLSKASLALPSTQSALALPSGAPEYVTVGVGIQNYTCQAGVWTSVGAVASLYDASCMINTKYFSELPEIAYEVTSLAKRLHNFGTRMSFPLTGLVEPIAHHFFVPAPNGATGLDPRFNLDRTSKFSILSKTASIASPDGAANVAWLQLTTVQGALAKSVYRVDTYKGQPPTSCSAPSSQVLTVPYAAMYYFF